MRKANSLQQWLEIGVGIGAFFLAAFAIGQESSSQDHVRISLDTLRHDTSAAQVKFSLDFPGGTVAELVAAIGEAAANKINIVIPVGLEDVPVQKFNVSEISFADLSELLSDASQNSVAGRLEFHQRNGGWIFANKASLHSGQFGIKNSLESELSEVHEQLEEVERQLLSNAFAQARMRAQTAGRREVELSVRNGNHSLASQQKELRAKLYTLSRRATALKEHLAATNESAAMALPRRSP